LALKRRAALEKNFLRGLIGLIFAIFIVGCAAGPIGKLPTIADEKKAGEITVIRASSVAGATNSYVITLNGVDVFGIRSGQYTKFRINEGEHHIGIKCFGGWSPTWKEESLKFTATPNSSLYFLATPTMNCASIISITQEEGLKRMQNSEYIAMEQ
jgi:hypothetical protein